MFGLILPVALTPAWFLEGQSRPINNEFQRPKKNKFFRAVIIDYFWAKVVKSETIFLLLLLDPIESQGILGILY